MATFAAARRLLPFPVREPAYVPASWRLRSLAVVGRGTPYAAFVATYRAGAASLQLTEAGSHGAPSLLPLTRLDGAPARVVRRQGDCPNWVEVFFPHVACTVLGQAPLAALRRVAASLRPIPSDKAAGR